MLLTYILRRLDFHIIEAYSSTAKNEGVSIDFTLPAVIDILSIHGDVSNLNKMYMYLIF